LFQVLTHTVIACNAASHLLELIGGQRGARAVGLVQADTQIPNRSVSLPPGASAVRLAAGQKALRQGTSKDFPDFSRRQKFEKTVTTVAQGESRKPREGSAKSTNMQKKAASPCHPKATVPCGAIYGDALKRASPRACEN